MSREPVDPEEWPSVYRGLIDLIGTLRRMWRERRELARAGYGDPLDGFVPWAVHVAAVELRELRAAQAARDVPATVQTLTRLLSMTSVYAEQDLSWSKAWRDNLDAFGRWLGLVGGFRRLARENPRMFAELLDYPWHL